MYSGIDWSRLSNLLDEMDKIRPTSRIESACQEDPTEPGIAGWSGWPSLAELSHSGGSIALHDPACHSIWGKTRFSNPTNKISGV